MTRAYGSLSIAGLSALIQSGRVDPVTVAEQVLDDVEKHSDPAIFTALTRERALAEARASSARIRAGRSLGLLDGIPVAWKDLFDMRGMVTAAGSQLLLETQAPADRDADLVTRLSQAGMIATGRVNMSEFAFSGLGLNPHFGTPRNACGMDVPRIPGGSSSGSAVAVAAGLVPVSIGSDTGGSIRIPAAFNGIVGYKATRGRYPGSGVFPLAGSLDSFGPLCHTVQDAVWVDAAMRGSVAPGVQYATLAGQEFVIPSNVVFDDVEPGVKEAFEAAISRLKAAGATVERAEIPAFSEVLDLMSSHGALVTAEAYWLHRARVNGPDAGRIDPRVVARARLGASIALTDYLDLVAARSRLIGDVRALIGDRLIAFPTVAHVAPPVAPLERDDSLFARINAKTLRNTMLGNFLDWCGISIPCGAGDAGMPVGFLISGLPGRDEQLLSVALTAESVIRGEV